MWQWIIQFGNHQYSFKWANRYATVFLTLGLTLVAMTIFTVFYYVPIDFQQGSAFRLIYIHVPCAVLSMGMFAMLGILGIVYMIWRITMADMIASAVASIGLSVTILAIITGSIWGKPTWGTWWIWDARLTSELILAFLYLGVIATRQALKDTHQVAMVAAAIGIIGTIDLPIIHYSVTWWHTLHQGPTLLALKKPTIAPIMLWPLLVMILATSLYVLGLVLKQCCTVILQRDCNRRWVIEWLKEKGNDSQ